MSADTDNLKVWLARRSAALPPLSETVLGSVEQRGTDWWETPGLEHIGDPTDATLAAISSGTFDSFFLVGLSGRGYASWFFHVVLADGPLVVIARLLAPTAFDDHPAGPSLGRVLDGIGPLARAARGRLDRGALDGAERFVVLDDERTSRYRYGTLTNGGINWQQTRSTTLFDEACLTLSEGAGAAH